MNLLKVFILVSILIVPIGATSISYLIDDDQTCELMENFGEEEEGDDSEEKSLEETEFIRDHYNTRILYNPKEDHSLKEYASHNELHNAVVLEVQTPPPENTMC